MPKGIRVKDGHVVRGKEKNKGSKLAANKIASLVSATEARELMQSQGFNPILELIKRYQDDTLSNVERNACLLALAKRYAPSLKSVDAVQDDSPKDKGGVQINILAPSQPMGHVIDVDIPEHNENIKREQIGNNYAFDVVGDDGDEQ